ncbi:DEAD (Asp-Glu-Ala-Asp) box polypeptide 52 [Mactra antiquata]
MDAFDLFRKLGVGTKIDYKRFRGDAEKLHILKPKPEKTDVPKSFTNITQDIKKELNGDGDDDDDDKNAESDKSSSDSEATDSSSESDSSNSNSDTDDNDDNDSSGVDIQTDSVVESELQLLGNIKSKGNETASTLKELRKLRKRKNKVVDIAKKNADIKQEQINHLRNLNRVHAHGSDVPDPVESFDQLKTEYNIHSRIIQNIETVGYKKPTPIQIQAIPVMLHRREIMACAPTGSGKTAAFILPILHHLKEPRNEGIRALILAPTRELAKQTHREFQRLSEGIGFRIQYIDKTGTDFAKVKKVTKKCDVLVSTPNRLIYLIQQQPQVISLSSVQWLVVDESDKLFEEGKSGFRDQLAAIYKACDGNNVRRAMFSATFAYDVEQWCKMNLDNVIQVYIGAKNSATKSIEQSLVFCGAESGKLIAMRDIIRKGIKPPVLVFVQSKERAKELFHELIYDGMNVDVIHADRTQLQRDNVIKSFRAGKIWILICTELMGRGIDFKGVNLVINYDFPNSAISYIHRIGRTGRAGHEGKAVTFFTEDDAVYLRSIANVMRTSGCPVPEYMLKINMPSRLDRKKLSKTSLQRRTISTSNKFELKRERRKKNKIKRKKHGKKGSDKTKEKSVELGKRKHSDDKPQDGENKRFKKDKNIIQKKFKYRIQGKRLPKQYGKPSDRKGNKTEKNVPAET